MRRNLAHHHPVVRRILEDQDTLIGFFALWGIGLIIFPLGGFYLATIFEPATTVGVIRNYRDLQPFDITYWGGLGALGGLVLGVILGLWGTFRYPIVKERERLLEEHREHEIHAELTHHEEIMTIPGQEPEHIPHSEEGD